VQTTHGADEPGSTPVVQRGGKGGRGAWQEPFSPVVSTVTRAQAPPKLICGATPWLPRRPQIHPRHRERRLRTPKASAQVTTNCGRHPGSRESTATRVVRTTCSPSHDATPVGLGTTRSLRCTHQQCQATPVVLSSDEVRSPVSIDVAGSERDPFGQRPRGGQRGSKGAITAVWINSHLTIGCDNDIGRSVEVEVGDKEPAGRVFLL
jgi:hypothetical protein